MLNRTMFATACLFLSTATSAAIVDLGVVTRDTSTGLEWLDLTETAAMTYYDVTDKMATGGLFEGWRYASNDEVQTLWKNFGLENGTVDEVLLSDTIQYAAFIEAVSLLGNIHAQVASFYDYGTAGITGTPLPGFSDAFVTAGMYHIDVLDSTSLNNGGLFEYTSSLFHGSYLVRQQVPLPAALWLFLSALIGLRLSKGRNNVES